MTYKLELFLVLQRKRLINIKSFKNYVFFIWFTYIGLFIFYIKLTYLAQKSKNFD